MKQFPFPSKSSPGKVYTAVVADDCRLLCDCKGWTTKKTGKPRSCTHTQQVARQLGTVVTRGDYEYLTDSLASDMSPAWGRAGGDTSHTPPPPMLASAMVDRVTGADFDRYYANDRWAMEEKLDGHRLQVVVTNGQVTAYARPQAGAMPRTRDLPTSIVTVMRGVPNGIYDGELCGPPGSTSSDVVMLGQQLRYIVFDLLEIKHQSWQAQPYDDRRQALALLPFVPPVQLISNTTPHWATIEQLWSLGGEGVVLKRRASSYQAGIRSPDWCKVKRKLAATLTITGFEAGENGPYSKVLLVDDQGTKTSVKTKNTDVLRQLAANPTAYIGRQLTVSYQERTKAGAYRHIMADHLL